MKKQIILGNKKIEYILKNSIRARRMRLAIHYTGDFIITKPLFLSKKDVEQFIIEKSNWILSKIEYFKKFNDNPFLKNDKKNYLKYKDEALRIAYARIDCFNRIYNLDFNRISIKNQKTRWGSCSRKKNLNFNYKIALLQEDIADYIIVHELCHLKELNHSQRFWDLVAKAIPNYLDIRKRLKDKDFGYYKQI
ncbi:MAG: SprT family zinc-dependent metalloprotease [bacterium]